MFLCHCHNAQCQAVRALGNHHRGIVAGRIILDRYSVMGRISDYNIGRRHLLHHTLPCLSLLAFPDLTLDLGIAFGLFVLLFEFLPGHTQVLFVVPPLIEQVKSCHKSHGDRHRLDYGQDHIIGIDHGLEWFHIHQPGEVPEILLKGVPDDGTQNDDLDHRLEQFNDAP